MDREMAEIKDKLIETATAVVQFYELLQRLGELYREFKAEIKKTLSSLATNNESIPIHIEFDDGKVTFVISKYTPSILVSVDKKFIKSLNMPQLIKDNITRRHLIRQALFIAHRRQDIINKLNELRREFKEDEKELEYAVETIETLLKVPRIVNKLGGD